MRIFFKQFTALTVLFAFTVSSSMFSKEKGEALDLNLISSISEEQDPQVQREIQKQLAMFEELSKIVSKSESIVFPELKLDQIPLSEAISIISSLSKLYDSDEKDHSKKGISIAVGYEPKWYDPIITINAKNITFGDAFDSLLEQSGFSHGEEPIPLTVVRYPGKQSVVECYRHWLNHSEAEVVNRLKSILVPNLTAYDVSLVKLVMKLNDCALYDFETHNFDTNVAFVPIFDPQTNNPNVRIAFKNKRLIDALPLLMSQIDFHFELTDSAVILSDHHVSDSIKRYYTDVLTAKAGVEEQLRMVKMPKGDFKDVPLSEVIQEIHDYCQTQWKGISSPDQKPLQIRLNKQGGEPDPIVSFEYHNMHMLYILGQLAEKVHYDIRLTDKGVTFEKPNSSQ